VQGALVRQIKQPFWPRGAVGVISSSTFISRPFSLSARTFVRTHVRDYSLGLVSSGLQTLVQQQQQPAAATAAAAEARIV